MKAFVYLGPGAMALEDRLIPWSQAITTRLVDTVTTPLLLKIVQAGKVDPTTLITHRFSLNEILDAYETFGHASTTGALKVIIEV